jgi:hypothetical protein
MKRYRIRAWGAANAPDINEESDTIPERRLSRYPNVDISLQAPVCGEPGGETKCH